MAGTPPQWGLRRVPHAGMRCRKRQGRPAAPPRPSSARRGGTERNANERGQSGTDAVLGMRLGHQRGHDGGCASGRGGERGRAAPRAGQPAGGRVLRAGAPRAEVGPGRLRLRRAAGRRAREHDHDMAYLHGPAGDPPHGATAMSMGTTTPTTTPAGAHPPTTTPAVIPTLTLTRTKALTPLRATTPTATPTSTAGFPRSSRSSRRPT